MQPYLRFLIISNSIILFISSYLYSCAGKDPNILTTSNNLDANEYRLELKDSIIVESISEYIQTNEVDIKNAVITLFIQAAEHRTRFYISHNILELDTSSVTTIGYTILNDAVVIVRSGAMDYFTPRTTVMKEIKSVLQNNGIVLRNEMIIFDPPVWNIVKCGDRVIKNADYYQYDLPCGLVLNIDKKEQKLIIEEEEWLKEAKSKLHSSTSDSTINR